MVLLIHREEEVIMYIAEIINPEKCELEYNSEIFSSQEEAEAYINEVCEDRHGLEGVVISVLIEKQIISGTSILTRADVVYHT